MVCIEKMRKLSFNSRNIVVTKHAKNRLFERSITISDVKHAIATGELIKQYEDDRPFPSCLLLAKIEQDRYIHVVASIDASFVYIITAYQPNEVEWDADFKTRRKGC